MDEKIMSLINPFPTPSFFNVNTIPRLTQMPSTYLKHNNKCTKDLSQGKCLGVTQISADARWGGAGGLENFVSIASARGGSGKNVS